MISPLDFFISTRASEGGWGYAPNHSPAVEPTCAVLLALQKTEQFTVFDEAASWLLGIQNSDGGWGYNHLDASSSWLTGWAVWALSGIDQYESSVSKGATFLLEQEVLQINNLDDLAAGERVAQIDFSLRGWPWRTGEASWVEPTSLSLVALYTAGIRQHDRMREAITYLDNRRCPGGGWNVGNPVMFGEVLPARAHQTAWSLMALSKAAPEKVLVQDIDMLKQEMKNDAGVMAAAWGCLALRACGNPLDGFFLDQLEQLQAADGSWEQNPYLTALAWLVLSG